MDARIAKALRNSPHQNEFKYLYLLPSIKKEERKREVIRKHLPSVRILCENVRRFMCVGDDFDLQTAKILWKHPPAALLVHTRLVQGLIIVIDYRAIQVQITFERFLDTALVELKRLRELTSSQLFATPEPSPAHSLRSASSVASLVSVPGSEVATQLSTPTRQILARVRRRLLYDSQPSLMPPDEGDEDFDKMSQVSWKSLRQEFQRGINDEERRRKVTMEEFDLTMSSINSQDLVYQREFFNDYIEYTDSHWIDEELAVGFGTQGIDPGNPRSYFELASPLPPDGTEDSSRRFFRILEFPVENQPFPTGDSLKNITEREFEKDAFRRPSSHSEKPRMEWEPQDVPHSSPKPGPDVPHSTPKSGPDVAHSTPKPGPDVPHSSPKPGSSTAHPVEEHISPIHPVLPSGAAVSTVTHEPTDEAEAAPETGGPVLNPAWAPFPIWVDGPEPAAPETTPRGKGGYVSFLNVTPDPDIPVIVLPRRQLRDITEYHLPEPPRPPKPKRKLGPMKSRLKFQSTRLHYHCKVIRNHIWNPNFKIGKNVNRKIPKAPKPIGINLEDPPEPPCPRKSYLPVIEDSSGIFVPLISPEPSEEDELSEFSFDSESEETSSHDSSWETIDSDDSDDSWIVPDFSEEEWPVLEEELEDEGWLYQPITDFFYWQRSLRLYVPPTALPKVQYFMHEFPPKFRFKRAPLVSNVVRAIYPDWQTRRHPSELPPPPAPLPDVVPQITDVGGTAAIPAPTTTSTSGVSPAAGMVTGAEGSKSQGPSVGLATGVSSLEPQTFSSLLKKPISVTSGEDGKQLESVPSISGPGLTLPPVAEGEDTTVIRRPGEEGAAGPVAGVPGAPGETGVAEGPAVTGVAEGPAVTGVAEGPAVTGVAEGPAVTGVAEGPAAEGATAVLPPTDFQFAVPEPVIRPRRICRVQPRYQEYDEDEDEYYEPPRRRRRRRRRVPALPPPPPPAEVEPMEFGEAGPIAPLPVDAAAADVEPQEPETPKVWDPDRVKALLRRMMKEAGERVVRFSDCCEPDVCPRKSAASFFAALLVLDAENIISLEQRSKDGSPFELFIVGFDTLFEFEE